MVRITYKTFSTTWNREYEDTRDFPTMEDFYLFVNSLNMLWSIVRIDATTGGK